LFRDDVRIEGGALPLIAKQNVSPIGATGAAAIAPLSATRRGIDQASGYREVAIPQLFQVKVDSAP
jgi:hypothetical protein